jgi:hypothetical protein
MDWIKKNSEQFLLMLLALALIGMSIVLILWSLDFRNTFAGLKDQIVPNNKVQPVNRANLEQALAKVQKPNTWNPHKGSLFVSKRFLVQGGKLVDPFDPDNPDMVHAPVPNAWFVENDIEITDPNALEDDPDSDGFSNLDEWQAKSDPHKAESHPAYATKLRLKQFIRRPFRLKFQAYDGDTYQINTVDVHQPTQFLKAGEMIAGTKFKILSFEPKKLVDANGVEKDISELTIQNMETQARVVMVLEKIVNSPDSVALMHYIWDDSDFQVKKDQVFTIKPEADVQYKLIDIQENEALIENLKTGDKTKAPKMATTKR